MTSKFLANILLVLIPLLITNPLSSKEKAPSFTYLSTNNDPQVFEGFSSFNFYFFVSAPSEEIAKKLNKIAMDELGNIGTVIPGSINVKSPTEGINNPLSSFNSPSLIYTLETLCDWKGNPLSCAVASLEFKGMVSIEKTKLPAQACLWSRKCYIQGDISTQYSKAVSSTLNLLLKEFVADYTITHKKDSPKATFNYMQP